MANEFIIKNGFRSQGNSEVTGSLNVTGGITGSLQGTATTASYFAGTVATASYSLTASYVLPLSQSVYITGSFNLIGNTIHTGSVFHSGSKILVGIFSQTGSLNISGSTTQTGTNNLFGNTTLSGSIIISGSTTVPTTPSIKVYGDMETNGVIKFMPVVKNIDTNISASYIFVSGSTNDLYFSQNGSGYNNVTRLRWLEGNMYSGLLNGGLITTQSSTVYQVQSGSGIIVALNASIGSNPYPVVQYLNWPTLSASIAPLSASYDQQFISVTSGSTLFAQGVPFNDGQFDTQIPLGIVLHQNHSTINGVKTQPELAYGWKQRSNIFIDAFGPLKLSGHVLTVSGSSTGSIIVTSGTSFADGANYQADPNNPSYVNDPGTTVSKIFRYYQSGSAWVYNTNGGAGYGAIDPTRYSNGGVLAAVPTNNFSIQRVFWYPNSVTKAAVVYYGNATYPTQAEAIANLNIETFVEAPNTATNAIYVGALIVRHNADFTVPVSFTIIPAGLFRQIGGSGGGGSAITSTLSGLSDVSISGPTNGQPLVYDTAAARWRNQSTLTATLTGNASTATTASFAITSSAANITDASDVNAQFHIAFVANTGSTQVIAADRDGLYNPKFNTLTVTASYATQAISASYATQAISASYATVFPYTGSAIISGSLAVLGKITGTTNGVTVLDSGASTLYSSNTSGSVAWNDRFLQSSNAARVVRWNTQILQDTGEKNSIDWASRLLYDSNAVSATNWNLRQTYDTSATLSTDWDKRQLIYSSAVVLDWKNAIFSGSVHGTASYATQALSASWAPGGGGGTPGGSDTQIQFNNAGAFGGSNTFTFSIASGSVTQGNYGNIASGLESLATGKGTIASAAWSHTKGSGTNANGTISHAEGQSTRAGNNNGYLATAVIAGDIVLDSIYGDLTAAGLFAPGYIAAIDDSAYDGNHTYATISVASCSFDGTNTHVHTPTGSNTTTLVIASLSNQSSNAGTYVWGGLGAHAEGNSSISVGTYAHAEGNGQAFGSTAHAEGGGYAIGDGTHAEGGATAVGNYSHAEGNGSTYAGYAHAEGTSQAGYLALGPNTPITAGVFELDPAYGDLTSTFAAGQFVLINDDSGQINGIASTYLFEIASSTYNATPATEITLVDTTVATVDTKYIVGVYGNALPPGVALSQDGIGTYSHAEGENTQAIGRASHAAGISTRALGWYQSVVGTYNQPISTPGAFIVGDGLGDTTLHNLLVAASGSVVITGSLFVSGSITSTNGVATKSNVVPNTGFGGLPLTASVTFAASFPNTNYAVVVTGEDARIWNIKGKTTSSFIIESNSSIALTGDTFWHATGYGEFNG